MNKKLKIKKDICNKCFSMPIKKHGVGSESAFFEEVSLLECNNCGYYLKIGDKIIDIEFCDNQLNIECDMSCPSCGQYHKIANIENVYYSVEGLGHPHTVDKNAMIKDIYIFTCELCGKKSFMKNGTLL